MVMSGDSRMRPQAQNTIIMDFGSVKGDDIDDLRRGEGKVFNKIGSAIEELSDSGQISDNIQPIIVIFK